MIVVPKQKDRDFKFDLLKIVAMLMIIVHHITINDFGLQKVLNGVESTLSNNQIIVLIISNALCIVGVNLFFLISGFFKIKFSFKKLINLILQVYIVYAIVTLIGIYTNHVTYNKDILINLLNPFEQYWFITAYVGLMILSPILNNGIDHISDKEAKIFIVLSILFFAVYAFNFNNGVSANGGYSLIFASILYIFGGIISKFNYSLQHCAGLIIYLICVLINIFVIYRLYTNGPLTNTITAWNMYRYNNILVLIQSLGLFLFVNSINISIKKSFLVTIIGFLSSNTLMTYLLHSTCWLTYFRHLPVEVLLNNGLFKLGIILLPLYAIGIFIICSVIGLIYRNTFQRVINCINK